MSRLSGVSLVKPTFLDSVVVERTYTVVSVDGLIVVSKVGAELFAVGVVVRVVSVTGS